MATGSKIKGRLRKAYPLPKTTVWTARAGRIAGAGAASSYKAQDIPEDAAKAIASHFGVTGGERKLEILDSMAGEGKYGIPISQFLQKQGFKPRVDFVDLTQEMLDKIPPTGFPSATKRADMRWRPLPNKQYDAIVLRYGLERLGRKQQLAFFRDALNALRPGGILVHTSMVSPFETKGFMRGYKLKKGDPEIKTPATSHIPTHEEHQQLLEQAGFKPGEGKFHLANPRAQDGFYRSKVTATGWMLNHQFGKLPSREEGESDSEYLERAKREVPSAEQTRGGLVEYFWMKANPKAVSGIQLKFFDKDGKEIEWQASKRERERLSRINKVNDVQMNWPVATYVGVRPYKGGRNRAGRPSVSESRRRK